METILMTGGTGLIAKVQVPYFLNQGYKVVITYRNEEKFNAMKHPNLIGIKIDDLLKDSATDDIVGELEKMKVFPEILINAATDGSWHKMNEDGFAPRECMVKHYIGNVVFPYELSFKLANHPQSRLKKIINISSMYGIVPYNPFLYENPKTQTPLQYGLSKCALIQLSKELAIRFKDKNIMVNTVSYGGVDGRVDDAFKKRFAELTPLKRMMKPEETIPAVNFLVKDTSGYMTGQNIIVDGGRTIW